VAEGEAEAAASASVAHALASSVVNATVDVLTTSLTEVIAGLDTAFVTTGEGLIAALILHLSLTFVRRSDERLLDDCRRYAARNITAHVRITPDSGS
jgi:biopolymer transport protein ExbB/TolQ